MPIAAAILALIGWMLAHTVLRGVEPSQQAVDAIRQTLLPDLRQDLAPKSLERWLFILLTLLSPFCVFAGLRLARLLTGSFSGRKQGFAAGGIALLAGGLGVYLLHGGSLFQFFVFPQSPVIDLAIVYVAGMLLFLGARGKGRFAPVRQFDLLWRVLVVALAFAVALLPRGLSTRSILSPTKDISPFAWEVHFQAVAYSLSQVYAGKPLLTAAPPLYGNYAEFLLPVFKLIGLSVFKFCVVMGLIQSVALASILLVAVTYLRTPATRLLCCAALIYFVGSTCLIGKRPFDPVFQYYPIRFIFPALSIPLFLWAARRATPEAWIGLGVFAGLALMWNLDSGIAVAGATLFVFTLEAIGARRKQALLAVIITGIAMAVTAASFRLFLQMQAGWQPPFHYTADYQRLFYQSGYMMTSMPLGQHPWWLVVAVYLLGMGFGIQRALRQKCDAVTRLSVFLSVLGLGLFTYYEGRSVDFNLMNAAWPAILLAFVFGDRMLRAVRTGLLPRGMCWTALPAAYLGLMALAMLPAALASTWSFGSEQWQKAMAPSATGRADTIHQRVQFIEKNVGSDSDCVILADYQAVYFLETGLRSSMDAPGLTEIFFMQDLDKLRSALTQNPPRHLFVDEPTLKTLQLTDTINTHFRTVATFPDGKLVYMEPR